MSGDARCGVSRKTLVAGMLCFCCMSVWQSGVIAAPSDGSISKYRSPEYMAVSPDGQTAYVSDRTSGNITILDLAKKSKVGEVPVEGQPRGVCLSPDGKTLYVAERGASTVAVIDTVQRKVGDRIRVDRRPVAVALAPKAGRLFVGVEDTNSIWVFDVAKSPAKLIKKLPAVREPCSVAVTADERFLVVANLLPDGVSTDPTLSAVVSIFPADSLGAATQVKLPPGSTSVNGLCVDPAGKFAYVVHSLGRFTLPITQLERGWVNTTALTVIEVATKKRVATMLLDSLTLGAADPVAATCTPDGKQLCISHAGTHEVTIIDVVKLHELLSGKVPAELASLKDGSLPNIWVRIQQDPKQISELENDLTALYIAGVSRRVPSGGKGPRGVATTSDGKTLLVANYFSGSVALLGIGEGRVAGTISLGEQPEPDSVRRGELIFHDATKAFQHWYSCATCHPNEGRVDALSWDFLRDGIGNPKETINLVYLNKTEPLNRRATRATARECAKTGLATGHMIVPTEEQVDDLLAFLVSLKPEPSPYLEADGKLSQAALRGKQLFEGKADCARCHPGPYFTDKKMHDIGTFSPPDPDGHYDTPALIETYRTAPYLHDGRARTIRDVLTTHNPHNRHGKTKDLTPQELDDLATYILSL